ncbi:MAG TPA: hypothetical protein PLO53_08440, partial [Candidatus Hydrogenedentes bacterium]|nr:hypothetical protein [Candidatus Hydrogenedentota bacterium]
MRRSIYIAGSVLLGGLGLLIWVAGCAGSGDGQDSRLERGIFHGRWWNYYERGSLRLAAEDFQGAESDFRAALRSRSRDTWRARTYGLHFTEYFANRELGIALYHLGRYEEAESALRNALGMVDTERCRYYLDKTLRERLARGERQDQGPPELSLD